MFIKMEDIDELYSILLDLEMFVYLQGLVEFDSDGSCVFEHEFKAVTRNSQAFLFERQLDAVTRLDKLLHSERFYGDFNK